MRHENRVKDKKLFTSIVSTKFDGFRFYFVLIVIKIRKQTLRNSAWITVPKIKKK